MQRKQKGGWLERYDAGEEYLEVAINKGDDKLLESVEWVESLESVELIESVESVELMESLESVELMESLQNQ